jgi:hypothetical protein
MVADARTTTEVLAFVRALARDGTAGPRPLPPFTEITVRDGNTVVVEYIRN